VLRVGLTGGIASGKSVVAAVFERRGARLHRADAEAHRLMAPGGPAWAAVVARFGPALLLPDQTIDRRALGRIVFGDAAARRALNAILQPLVIDGLKAEAEAAEREGGTAVFVSEAALIFEAGLDSWFDKIVVAWCRPDVQARRLMARDGCSAGEAERRIAAQLPAEDKKSRADYVVDTSDEWEETLARAEAVWAFLLQDAARSKPPKPASR